MPIPLAMSTPVKLIVHLSMKISFSSTMLFPIRNSKVYIHMYHWYPIKANNSAFLSKPESDKAICLFRPKRYYLQGFPCYVLTAWVYDQLTSMFCVLKKHLNIFLSFHGNTFKVLQNNINTFYWWVHKQIKVDVDLHIN